jgi:hypothetical protein
MLTTDPGEWAMGVDGFLGLARRLRHGVAREPPTILVVNPP